MWRFPQQQQNLYIISKPYLYPHTFHSAFQCCILKYEQSGILIMNKCQNEISKHLSSEKEKIERKKAPEETDPIKKEEKIINQCP